MAVAIDKIRDPRVKKERKLYLGKKWSVVQSQGTSYLTVDKIQLGTLDWGFSRFLEDELYVWLTGADHYIVLLKVDEEGYVPPAKIDFGPAPVTDDTDDGEG